MSHSTQRAFDGMPLPASIAEALIPLPHHLWPTRPPPVTEEKGYGARRLDAMAFAHMPSLEALPPAIQAVQHESRMAVAQVERRLGRAPVAREVADELGWLLSRLFHGMVAAGAGGLRRGDPPIETLDARRWCAASGSGIAVRSPSTAPPTAER